MFHGKKIVIGITGGIAAYKVCWLIRSIKKQGGAVRVILTNSGERFITRTTLEALSEEPVARDTFDPVPDTTIQHIDLARWCNCFLIAPATANIMAKAAHGIADDLLSTTIVSYPGSIVFAPAMNDEMWKNGATRHNCEMLTKRGHRIVPPGTGDLACHTVGIGRMAEPDEIEQVLKDHLGVKRDLAGRSVMITAGRTEEPVDSIRFISNRSSGKMGAALAEAALARGASVTLVAGVHTAEMPPAARTINAPTAQQMAEAVKNGIQNHEVLIMAAAVADFRPSNPVSGKIKKEHSPHITLQLEQTEDILKSVSAARKNRVMVGFSVETHAPLENARKKLRDKKLDLVVVNNPLEPGAGFDVDTNRITLLEKRKKPEKLPLLSKREAADRILDRVVKLLEEKPGG